MPISYAVRQADFHRRKSLIAWSPPGLFVALDKVQLDPSDRTSVDIHPAVRSVKPVVLWTVAVPAIIVYLRDPFSSANGCVFVHSTVRQCSCATPCCGAKGAIMSLELLLKEGGGIKSSVWSGYLNLAFVWPGNPIWTVAVQPIIVYLGGRFRQSANGCELVHSTVRQCSSTKPCGGARDALAALDLLVGEGGGTKSNDWSGYSKHEIIAQIHLGWGHHHCRSAGNSNDLLIHSGDGPVVNLELASEAMLADGGLTAFQCKGKGTACISHCECCQDAMVDERECNTVRGSVLMYVFDVTKLRCASGVEERPVSWPGCYVKRVVGERRRL